jgi:hypothetical protein
MGYDPKEISEEGGGRTRLHCENLGKMIRVPGFSCTEKDRIEMLKKLCAEAGLEDLRVDGLGSLLGRVGKGKKVLVFDAHIDTVGVGDPSQWKTPPHSGLVKDGLVYGRGASDQLGGAASMITAARILKDLAYAGDYTVWFAFTVIEEDCDGLCWKYLIEEEKFKLDSRSPPNHQLPLYRGTGPHGDPDRHQGHLLPRICPERGESAGTRRPGRRWPWRSSTRAQPDDDASSQGHHTVSQMKVRTLPCAVPDQAMSTATAPTWGETTSWPSPRWRRRSPPPGGQVLREDARIFPAAYTARSTRRSSTSHLEDPPTTRWCSPAWTPIGPVWKGADGDKWTFSTNCVAICGRHKIPCIASARGREPGPRPNEITRRGLEICSAFYASLPFAWRSAREVELPLPLLRREYAIEPGRYLCDRCSASNVPGKALRGVLECVWSGEYDPEKDGAIPLPVRAGFFPPIPVGDTPLWKPERLRTELGFPNLFLKDDTCNPSGSFKDRASYLVAAFARERGIVEIALASRETRRPAWRRSELRGTEDHGLPARVGAGGQAYPGAAVRRRAPGDPGELRSGFRQVA